MKMRPAIFLMLLLLTFSATAAFANQIHEVRALDFGTFSLTDSGAHTLVLSPTGTTSTPDGGIIRLHGGLFGIFQIDHIGTDPFYITIDDPVTLVHSSGAPSFTIDSFTYDPFNDATHMITADGAGSLTLHIGATLHIPAATVATKGSYRGTYNFMINF